MRPLPILARTFLAALAACAPVPEPVEVTINTPVGFVLAPSPAFQNQLNAERALKGASPLSYSAQLTAAAQVHANDMSRNGFFSHYSTDGSKLGNRVLAQGYRVCWTAENISVGQATLDETFAGWVHSTGHYLNMTARQPTEFGLAEADGNYRVLVLGQPGC